MPYMGISDWGKGGVSETTLSMGSARQGVPGSPLYNGGKRKGVSEATFYMGGLYNIVHGICGQNKGGVSVATSHIGRATEGVLAATLQWHLDDTILTGTSKKHIIQNSYDPKQAPESHKGCTLRAKLTFIEQL